MRSLLIAVGVALAGVTAGAALLIVSTGKTFVFTFGAGYPNRASGGVVVAMGVFSITLALGMALHVCANLLPRRYYHLMWWRDLAFVVSGTSLLVAIVSPVWRQFEYGAF